MAHYVFIDNNNIVTEVFAGRDEWDLPANIESWESYYSSLSGKRCVRTSYNGNFRKQYAGIGYTYSAVDDVFIAPQPYPSWSLDDDFEWTPPIPRPSEGSWVWNEDEQDWIPLSVD